MVAGYEGICEGFWYEGKNKINPDHKPALCPLFGNGR